MNKHLRKPVYLFISLCSTLVFASGQGISGNSFQQDPLVFLFSSINEVIVWMTIDSFTELLVWIILPFVGLYAIYGFIFRKAFGFAVENMNRTPDYPRSSEFGSYEKKMSKILALATATLTLVYWGGVLGLAMLVAGIAGILWFVWALLAGTGGTMGPLPFGRPDFGGRESTGEIAGSGNQDERDREIQEELNDAEQRRRHLDEELDESEELLEQESADISQLEEDFQSLVEQPFEEAAEDLMNDERLPEELREEIKQIYELFEETERREKSLLELIEKVRDKEGITLEHLKNIDQIEGDILGKEFDIFQDEKQAEKQLNINERVFDALNRDIDIHRKMVQAASQGGKGGKERLGSLANQSMNVMGNISDFVSRQNDSDIDPEVEEIGREAEERFQRMQEMMENWEEKEVKRREIIENLEADLRQDQENLGRLKGSVRGIKNMIGGIWQELKGLKPELGSLRKEVGEVEQEAGETEEDLGSMKKMFNRVMQEEEDLSGFGEEMRSASERVDDSRERDPLLEVGESVSDEVEIADEEHEVVSEEGEEHGEELDETSISEEVLEEAQATFESEAEKKETLEEEAEELEREIDEAEMSAEEIRQMVDNVKEQAERSAEEKELEMKEAEELRNIWHDVENEIQGKQAVFYGIGEVEKGLEQRRLPLLQIRDLCMLLARYEKNYGSIPEKVYEELKSVKDRTEKLANSVSLGKVEINDSYAEKTPAKDMEIALLSMEQIVEGDYSRAYKMISDYYDFREEYDFPG